MQPLAQGVEQCDAWINIERVIFAVDFQVHFNQIARRAGALVASAWSSEAALRRFGLIAIAALVPATCLINFRRVSE